MPNPEPFSLSIEELRRYSRQVTLPKFGPENQEKLKNARVAVIGAGGLGAPLLQYLTAAGVGTIGIFDFDQVDITNLQRQVLYKTGDAGKPKAETAGSVLQELNPNVNFNIHPEKITADNAVNLLQDYHIIADGSDNFLTRSILNIASLLLDIPLVYGSVYQYEGQLTVFNYVDESGNRGPEYGDVFPEVPDQDVIPNCAQAGVIGALPGIIGSAQAMEVIKIITGIGSVLSGRLLIADMLEMDFTTIEIPVPGKKERPDIDELKKKLVRLSEKADQNEKYDSSVNWITPSELKTLLEEKAGQFQLIDVRSPEEHQLSNIGGTLIPLDEIENNRHAFSSGKKTVIYCETGNRSEKAIQILQNKYGFKNLINLKGGVSEWFREIDTEKR